MEFHKFYKTFYLRLFIDLSTCWGIQRQIIAQFVTWFTNILEFSNLNLPLEPMNSNPNNFFSVFTVI